MDVAKLCRLCLWAGQGTTTATVDMFHKVKSKKGVKKTENVFLQVLEIFQVELIETSILPSRCCENCAQFLREIGAFKEAALRNQTSFRGALESARMGEIGSTIDNQCRLCKSEDAGNGNIFQDSAEGQTYSQHIQDLLNIELMETEVLPASCCTLCLHFLDKMRSFRVCILNSHASFLRYIEEAGKESGTVTVTGPTIDLKYSIGNFHTVWNRKAAIRPKYPLRVRATASAPVQTEKSIEEEDSDSKDILEVAKEEVDSTDDSLAEDEEDDESDYVDDLPDNSQEDQNDSTSSAASIKEPESKGRKSKSEKQKTAHKSVSSAKKYETRPLLSWEEKQQLQEEEAKLEDRMREMDVLICNVCQQKATSYKNLHTHMKKVHKQEAGIVCCGKFRRGHTMSFDHLRVHVNPDAFTCKICGKATADRVSLKQHIAYNHSTTPSTVRNYVCETCGKSFHKTNELDNHKNTHIPKAERPLKCSYCKERFGNKQELKKHTARHTCKICGETFAEIGLRRAHKAIHKEKVPKEKPMEPQQFSQCDVCLKHFLDMPRHKELSHGQVRPKKIRGKPAEYAEGKTCCDKCGKYFKATYFPEHSKICGEAKVSVFTCETCGRVFAKKALLSLHLKSHGPKHHLDCPYCPTKFSQENRRLKHIKDRHPEEEQTGGASGSRCTNGPEPDRNMFMPGMYADHPESVAL